MDNPVPATGPNRPEAFQTTHWSVVLSAGHESEGVARAALEKLCQAYWFPLYAYVRRQGHSPEDSQDLTQAFFERFLERGYFARADQERGWFRTFLLTSLQHFLQEEWRRNQRQKRGGGATFATLSPGEAEQRYTAEPRHELSPDVLYDRRWAEAVLERVMARLANDYASTGRTTVYTRLQQFLWGRQAEVSYAAMGAELGLAESAVKVAVHRLRQRFRDLLREEVANTVQSADQIEAELRHLMAAFAA